MALSVGDAAPEFELPGVDGLTGEERRYTLSEFAGAPVVIAFYPADNSPVCSRQLEAYTRGIAEFDRVGAQVLAISPQSVESHRHFAATHDGFAFPLLADEDKVVGGAYGVLGLLDLYRRSTFVVDAEGDVAWVHRYVGMGLNYRSTEDLVGALEDVLGED